MNTATRLRKLRSMSGVELRTRLAAAVYRVYERRALRAPAGRRTPPVILADGNCTSSPPRFLASVEDLAATRRVLETHYPQKVADSIARADRMIRGEFTLFGQRRPLGEIVDWHADPISGARWPLLYHGDIPIGDRTRAPGDAKDVWELNRHQFLLDLAKAWLVTGCDGYAARIHQLVLGWIDANPYGLGVNWSGPLEVAYRALSWLWALALTGNRPMSDATRNAWHASFHDHGRFLFRHLELYESPFNHLIGESSVLYMLGVMFSGSRDAARWRDRGRHILESRLPEQFYADGGSVEQATVYHHATLGFYLLAALVARRNQEDFSPAVWSALERAIEYSMHLTQPDGRIPALGDNDDARPLAFDVRDNWDYRHFLAIGAVLFGRPDFKAVAGRMPEDAFWLLGPEGLTAFSAVADVASPQRSHVLPASGYVVLRNDRAGAPDYVCFDCGEHAGGLRTDDVPSAAHGHADALAAVVFLSGQSILVDAGFYTYDGDRSWERHFRETAAHNTVRVDRRDQARHLDKMSWSRVPSVTLDGFRSDGSGSWAVASHDGYSRSATGVRHRRTVWLRPNGYLIVYDELTGRGNHTAEIIFQLDERLEPALTGECLVANNRFVINWSATTILDAAVHRGKECADGGWIAPRLGTRVPAARLVLTASFSDTLGTLTTIADGHRWTRVVPHAGGPLALVHELAGGTLTEIVAASTGARVVAGGRETDGSIGVWREDSGRLVEAAHVGGTFITPVGGGGSC